MDNFWISNSDDFKNIYENSERIFFSGKYGIGKTTYLKNFFDKEENKDSFPIHIFPVNYAIEKNENILNLLKYDILYELVLIETFQNESKPTDKKDNKIKNYVIENADKLFIQFLKALPKIGKYVKDIESKWLEIKNDFNNFSNEEVESSKLNEFIQKIENQEGSIYENDFITTLINKKLDTHTKPVLILDDIDRIEPVHIFRILNIFSSLYDNTNYKSNKFNFSKIIIVGDIINIKSTYHHIYGLNSDFDGYIDKFYSTEIYYLSFVESLKSQIKKITYNDRLIVIRILEQLIILLFDSRELNFRQLKLIKKVFEIPEETQSLLVVLNHLSIFYITDLEKTTHLLKRLDFDFNNRNINTEFFEFILTFIIADYSNKGSDKIKISDDDPEVYIYCFNNNDYQVQFKKQNYMRDKLILILEYDYSKSQLVWQEFKFYLHNFELLKINK
jgi:hypothetical protein